MSSYKFLIIYWYLFGFFFSSYSGVNCNIAYARGFKVICNVAYVRSFRGGWSGFCWVSGSPDTKLLSKKLNKRVFIWNLTLWITILYNWLTDTSALQTRHLLTKYTCTHLTSRHLHTLALDSISLYTLTHFTSYNITPLSLGALWHSSQVSHTSH